MQAVSVADADEDGTVVEIPAGQQQEREEGEHRCDDQGVQASLHGTSEPDGVRRARLGAGLIGAGGSCVTRRRMAQERKTTVRSSTKLTAVPKPCDSTQADVIRQGPSGRAARAAAFTPMITKKVVP